jgi:copper chaperone NosL
MTKSSKATIFIAALLLAGIYFVPIWEILLDAPQYPERLQMKIHINGLSGDLQTINGLNHYIGMKVIEPESITELKIMPYILGFLIMFGIATGVSGKKSLLYTWFVLLLLTAAAGAVDFYMWEYDYGHNLDPRAIIKVPGMNYQPPLVGSKQLLNFTAQSLPDIGAYLAFAAGALALFIILRERKSSIKQQ